MSLSLLVSAWLVGTLGGLHCLAMCGGLMTAVAARDRAAQPLLPARAIAFGQLAYHAGRLATYALLGATFGAAGGAVLAGIDLVPLQRALYVVANLFLLALGLRLALGTPRIAWLQRAGAGAFNALSPVLRPLLRERGVAGRVGLGLVWGLVPCALVYSVLPLALFAGGGWQGAATLFAFGLGTLPTVASTAWMLGAGQRRLSGRTLRYASAGVLVAFAVVGLWRAVFAADGLAGGAFCALV